MNRAFLIRRPTLALVDDDLRTALEIIETSFRQTNASDFLQKCEVLLCRNLGELKEQSRDAEIDLVVTDLKLLDANGQEDIELGYAVVDFAVKELDAAVLVFSTEAFADAEGNSIHHGADDYIEKFGGKERISLRSRYWLERILREKELRSEKHKIGDWIFRPGQRLLADVSGQGKDIKISYLEHDLLNFLFRNPQQRITREEFNVWLLKRAPETKDRRLDNLVHRLRSKLDRADIIASIHGGGYRL